MGGKWTVSFGLIWPSFVGGHAKAVYCPEGRAVFWGVVVMVWGDFFFFSCSEGTQTHRGNTGST